MSITSWADCRQSGLASFYQEVNWKPYDGQYLASHDFDFTHGQVASVWVGTLPGEQAFNLYVEEPWENEFPGEDDAYNESAYCPLWDDLGFYVGDGRLQSRFWTTVLRVEDLINEFAGPGHFGRDLRELCKMAGICEANTILCLCGLQYYGATEIAFGCLRFVGTTDNLPAPQ